MDLNKLIDYAINKSGEQTNLEFEIRFGKYNISSNIKPCQFLSVYNLCKLKTHTLISETFYATGKEPVRHRVTYADEKNLIRDFFNKPAHTESDISSIVKKYAKNKSTEIYISKNKLMRESNILCSADIAIENTRQKPTEPETLKKYKLRSSSLENMWMYDLTILLLHDLKTGKSGIFYEIEIEYIHTAVIKNKYTAEDINTCANKIINNITTIIDCAKISDIEIEIKYNLFNAVVTLERQNLPLLQNAYYSVVDKADGERKFVYIDKKGVVFQFNPTEVYISKTQIASNAKNIESLIDCELIKLPNGELRFYGFDLLFFNGIDYRNYNLEERLSLLEKVIKDLNQTKSEYKYCMKKFYTAEVFKTASKLWNERSKLFPYNLDGLIFTPVRGAYLGNLPNFKYKPLVSIDVRTMFYDGFTEFYAAGHPIESNGRIINEYKINNKIYYKSRVTLNDPVLKSMGVVNDRGILGFHGRLDVDITKIVEMEFDPRERKWKYLRIRDDKENPNAFRTILSALNAIKDNITIEEISKLTHIKSPYELNDKSCFVKSGFNFPKDSSISSFYTYAYSCLLPAVSSILVIGCDLSLLKSLIASKYKEIVIIEPNCLEVYGRIKSEGYEGLMEACGDNRIKIIWGSGLYAYNKKDQAIINKYKKFDCIFIKSFESVDPKQCNKYIEDMQKMSDKIIGIFISGDELLLHLKTQDCIIMRNKELHPLWKLYKNKVKRIQNSFIEEPHTVILDKDIKTKKLESLTAFYQNYKKTGHILTDQEYIIPSITKYFII